MTGRKPAPRVMHMLLDGDACPLASHVNPDKLQYLRERHEEVGDCPRVEPYVHKRVLDRALRALDAATSAQTPGLRDELYAIRELIGGAS